MNLSFCGEQKRSGDPLSGQEALCRKLAATGIAASMSANTISPSAVALSTIVAELLKREALDRSRRIPASTAMPMPIIGAKLIKAVLKDCIIAPPVVWPLSIALCNVSDGNAAIDLPELV